MRHLHFLILLLVPFLAIESASPLEIPTSGARTVQKLYPTSARNGTALDTFGGQQREGCETLQVDHEKGHRGDL